MPGRPYIGSFSPETARAGDTVTITGSGFSNIGKFQIFGVAFGGPGDDATIGTMATSFDVVDDEHITAVVGDGASGTVQLLDSDDPTSADIFFELEGFAFNNAPPIPVNQPQLNRSNFLVWFGSFAAAPFTASAVDDAVTAASSLPSIDIPILANDVSTYGIDPTTIAIVTQDNVAQPATWNPTTRLLTYYLRPNDLGNVRQLQYKWSDVNGNVSNVANVSITINNPTVWGIYFEDFTCVKDGSGNNTGYGEYTQLRQFYTNGYPNNSGYWTLTGQVKPNVEGDPDYVAPALSPDCAAPSQIYIENEGHSYATSELACGAATGGPLLYTNTNSINLVVGTQFYTDAGLTTKFVGDGVNWYNITEIALEIRTSCQISALGVITAIVNC